MAEGLRCSKGILGMEAEGFPTWLEHRRLISLQGGCERPLLIRGNYYYLFECLGHLEGKVKVNEVIEKKIYMRIKVK